MQVFHPLKRMTTWELLQAHEFRGGITQNHLKFTDHSCTGKQPTNEMIHLFPSDSAWCCTGWDSAIKGSTHKDDSTSTKFQVNDALWENHFGSRNHYRKKGKCIWFQLLQKKLHTHPNAHPMSEVEPPTRADLISWGLEWEKRTNWIAALTSHNRGWKSRHCEDDILLGSNDSSFVCVFVRAHTHTQNNLFHLPNTG